MFGVLMYWINLELLENLSTNGKVLIFEILVAKLWLVRGLYTCFW
jgi:hypothetical protein